ncbi:DUF1800 domain-containing protein (plasmid) [Ensifer adhaerens]|uniref:DUF1800 domain-containing protein n=1 Tax=Ensifer adhaerens TaxID=106592 RepID=UPI002100B2AE|nr:DUF1800 domain-containing protein [Ensifer adhaerens]UTV41814.1 DUF1800 domain-containing protein [Ensifer adhaerens]
MTAPIQLADQSIVLNRFGLGSRGDESISKDAKAFLLDQLDAYETIPAVFAAARSATDILSEYGEDRRDLLDMVESARIDARKKLRQQDRQLYRDEVDMRTISALTTNAPFIERLVYFWSNHFAVSADKPQVTMLAGAFEREAIRPHVLGRFEDMLLAVEHHPAMLFFLDQVASTGPNSRRAVSAEKNGKGRQPGINENLAREIMELHTLGVRTGFTQTDVTEFALALSGWSIGHAQEDAPGQFRFRFQSHEPGARTIVGKTYRQSGERQALAVLSDLAQADATATHIATKLARHFISDDPPDGAVEKLKQSFLATGGDLPVLYRTLVDLPETWEPRLQKFKSPWEWAVSGLRACGRFDLGNVEAAQLLNQLGQPIWKPKSPAGYDDISAGWAAPEALVRRVEVSQRLVRSMGQVDARALAPKLLPGTLSERTETEIARAESPLAAMALVLVTPEFQRR